jgi:hypothetical protein
VRCRGPGDSRSRHGVGSSRRFFSMRYWFRSSDGMMIRYEGKESGPGSADLTLELIEEER